MMDEWKECKCESCKSCIMLQKLKTEGYECNALVEQALHGKVVPPPWYDKQKFLRGQEFFHMNFLSIFMSNLVSLSAILHVQGIVSVLSHTGKSSTQVTAAVRYLSTLRHVYLWYSGDPFEPGSEANKSIMLVRKMHLAALKGIPKEKCLNGCDSHNSLPQEKQLFNASNSITEATSLHSDTHFNHSSESQEDLRGMLCKSGKTQKASQVDMVATLWAFCALPCIKWRELGVAESSLHLMPDFIHFWRTVGYLMGVQDRFNICAPFNWDTSLQDSTSCSSETMIEKPEFVALLHQLLDPSIRKDKEASHQMVEALLRGIKKVVLVVEYEAFLCFSYRVLGLASHAQALLPLLSDSQQRLLNLQVYVFGTLLHRPVLGPPLRRFLNALLLFSITYADNPFVITAVDFVVTTVDFIVSIVYFVNIGVVTTVNFTVATVVGVVNALFGALWRVAGWR
ncbi:uncharacterized protein LOC108677985 [Hyalella azteca]|uniref:Uncharacterized protein LOC108677985 n=1 Tax=Hyalella azteca TaxID=294128 RepID=A0A8B7P6K3_HYAAZ|nr:uncharacterized protein LOC108677985 [Hyalella azteca]